NYPTRVFEFNKVPDWLFLCCFDQQCLVRSSCDREYHFYYLHSYRGAVFSCDSYQWDRFAWCARSPCTFNVCVCGIFGFPEYLLQRGIVDELAKCAGCVLVELRLVWRNDLYHGDAKFHQPICRRWTGKKFGWKSRKWFRYLSTL